MGKCEAENCLWISINKLKKLGFFKQPEVCGELNYNVGIKCVIGICVSIEADRAVLFYTKTNSNSVKEDFAYEIVLALTSCNYGGERYWFLCPGPGNRRKCFRRVGILYKPHYSDYFACRHCHDLTYASRNLSGFNRIGGKIMSIPDLEDLRKEIKCRYYNNKPTKRYLRYLKNARKTISGIKLRSKAMYNDCLNVIRKFR